MNKTEFESLFAGKYEYIRLLGKGGFAEVYLAKDRMLDRDVAIKILLSQYSEDEEIKERFIREARLYAKLEHKNVIPVYDTGIINGNAFIVMKYIEGQSLKDLIKREKEIPYGEIKKIIRDLSEALNYIHENGIVHRDIKPANILIENRTGKYFIADFGIARSESSNTLTQTGLIIGTPHYLSPEQIKGKKTDNRSDIYSFGAMLYELVSGQPIFQGVSSIEILYQHVNEEPKSIKELAPDCPDEIVYIIEKCLEKNPDNRFQTAIEILDALEGNGTQRLISLKQERKSVKRLGIILLFLIVILTSYFLIKQSFNKGNNKNAETTSGLKQVEKKDVSSEKDVMKNKIKSKKEQSKLDRGNLKKKDNNIQKKKTDNINTNKNNKVNSNKKIKTTKINKPKQKKEIVLKKKDNKKKTDIINHNQNKIIKKNLPGTIKFSSSYPAKVYLNGKLIGTTDQIFYKEFKPGKYRFTFYVDEMMKYEKEVELKAGETINLHQKIDNFGVVTILTKPLAKIYFNNKYVGETPIYKLKVPVGKYKIRAVKDGFESAEKIINIKREKKNINFILTRRE